MKTLKSKLTVEVLEDRMALSGSWSFTGLGPGVYLVGQQPSFVMADGSVRAIQRDVLYARTGMTNVLLAPEYCQAQPQLADEANRFADRPPSILVGMLLP